MRFTISLALGVAIGLSALPPTAHANPQLCAMPRIARAALRACDEAIRLNPSNAVSYANRGTIYNQKGDFDRAIADFNEALSCARAMPLPSPGEGPPTGASATTIPPSPTSTRPSRSTRTTASALRSAVPSYSRKQDYDRAIADFDQAINLNPRDRFARTERGVVFRAQGDLGRALTELDEVIRTDPRYAYAWAERGIIHRMMSNYDRAIADFYEALRLNPDDALSYGDRGIAYLLGRTRSIAHWWISTRPVRREYPRLSRLLGRGVVLRKGEYDRSIADLTEAIKLNPRDAESYADRGVTYRMKRDYDIAVADLSEALKINPRSRYAYSERALVYRST